MIFMEFHRFKSLTFCLLLAGCTPSLSNNDPVLSKLSNRGPILIAQDNPYLAANQFLAKQTAQSPELSGFLKLKGYPAAFSLAQSTFGPLTMTFFYPSAKEQYEFEKGGTTWIISGPFPLSESDAANLNLTNRGPTVPAPVPPRPAATPSTLSKVKPTAQKVKSSPTPTAKLKVAPPTATPLDDGFTSPEPIEKEAEVENTAAPVEVKSALAREDKKIDSAEISPRGDLVHYVTMPGETLSIIARWYTDDRENASKIGRLNRMKNSDSLSIGDTIVIPSYMIKNKARLSEFDLKRIADAAQREKGKTPKN